MTEQREELFKYIEKFFTESESKIDIEKYYKICDELGQEPDPEKIPLQLGDFPPIFQDAIVIFNSLGDRVYPDIGYLGKDYTNLDILIEVHKVEDRELLLELLLWMDRRQIKKSSDELKKAHEKMKRKSHGK